jgi:hypothetical protein
MRRAARVTSDSDNEHGDDRDAAQPADSTSTLPDDRDDLSRLASRPAPSADRLVTWDTTPSAEPEDAPEPAAPAPTPAPRTWSSPTISAAPAREEPEPVDEPAPVAEAEAAPEADVDQAPGFDDEPATADPLELGITPPGPDSPAPPPGLSTRPTWSRGTRGRRRPEPTGPADISQPEPKPEPEPEVAPAVVPRPTAPAAVTEAPEVAKITFNLDAIPLVTEPEAAPPPAATTTPTPPPTLPRSVPTGTEDDLTLPAGWSRPGAPTSVRPTPAVPAPSSTGPRPPSIADLSHQLKALETKVGRLGDQLDTAADRRNADRSAATLAEVTQQLTSTQAQIASLSAQLTTLSHRITYDLERGSQTTSERIVRDLGDIGPEITTQVSAAIGPAIDDLTDQIEADATKQALAAEALTAKLAALADTVDTIPLANVELKSAVQTLEGDLEDRFTSLATRVNDQISALERATTSELGRLREHLADLQASAAMPSADRDTIERMAGQVERLTQRASSPTEVADAVELLIAEHLEVLRDNVEAKVAALAPALQEELESVRVDAAAGIGATEETLAERIDALEASVIERVDNALSDQTDAFDAALADRLAGLMGAVAGTDDDRIEALAASVSAAEEATADRFEQLMGAVIELQEALVQRDEASADDPMAAVNDELKALRRRITLRMEGGDAPAGITPEQLEDLAEQIAGKLRKK